MKRVHCPPEPAELRTFRAANPNATWEDARDARVNESIFDALARAQGHICAYCEIRVHRPGLGQVEHFHPKHLRADLELDISNLLACCEGGTATNLEKVRDAPSRAVPPIGKTQHCGQLKGGKSPVGQMLDPRSVPYHPHIWRSDGQGYLLVDADHCAAAGVSSDDAQRTLDFLGLNRAGLVRLRKRVYSELDGMIADIVDPEAWQDARVRLAVAVLLRNTAGELPEFWSAVRAWGGPGVEAVLAERSRSEW